ncbi:tetratricopeptide repeat protein [Marinithermus hydrothermalis]|uniref:Tetratricopeptide TPR_1 repeat-containing protein n=1 Tax=Marinithermus hydrothermalis (strain DSM 14884 / JCM 11576 / T1) TaxID=869210 RepID=F2NNS4_MARHT|nr:tetratricopeptide repeat protein [Marinithermus hydrothermalis]AEB11298.1 Tetratricopeptide TPR_1 repeat-containing protein [Marinithermus hydrothermalis DSM 14884]
MEHTSVEDLMRAGRLEEAFARAMAGEAGPIEAIRAAMDLRELVWAKRYAEALRFLEMERRTLEPYLDVDRLGAGLEAFRAGGSVEAYLDDPLLGGEAWVLEGLRRVEAGDLAGARAAFEQAVALDPRHYRAVTNLANTYLEAGEVEEAIRLYRKAIKLNEAYPEAHESLAAAYRKQGKLHESVTHFKRAQRLRLRPRQGPRTGKEPARPGLFGGRWWVWIILIVAAYLLLNR